MLHSLVPLTQRHPVHNWEVADSTALAALVLSSVDIGKIALQLDTGDFLILEDNDPVSWANFSSPSIPSPGASNYGYLNIPQNSQSADYTLVLEDSGKHVYHPSTDAVARTFTIPGNVSVAFPIGTAVTFINMSTANITIAITADTLYLAGDGTTGSRTLAQYGMATAVKITSTGWLISGTGVS